MKQVTGNQQLVQVDPVDIVQYRWHRQENEPPKAFSYFKRYLRQDEPRSVVRVAREAGKHQTGILKLSAQYKWIDRASAYDEHRVNKELDKLRKKRELKDIEWLNRQEATREDEYGLADDLLDKVRQMSKAPVYEETHEETIEGIDPQGRIIIRQTVVYKPLNWTATDVVRYVDAISKLKRLSTGLDTDRKSIRIDVKALSDEELERLIGEK